MKGDMGRLRRLFLEKKSSSLEAAIGAAADVVAACEELVVDRTLQRLLVAGTRARRVRRDILQLWWS